MDLLPGGLVSAQWLSDHLQHPALRVLDCSVGGALTGEFRADSGLYKFESGRPLWAEGHIPGSVHVDLLYDLSDPDAPIVFMMPTPSQFARAMEQYGVGDDTSVVLYDRGPIQESARVWWMLRSIGFDQAAVLDGAWPAWVRGGYPTSTEAAKYPAGKITIRERKECFVHKDAVSQASRDGTPRLLHVLSEKEFLGQEARYGRPGRIPGSVNLPFPRLLDESGAMVPVDEIRRLAAEVEIADDPAVITYCGGGLAAAFAAYALTLAGRSNVAVYDGSLLEWAQDPTLPLDVG